MRIRTQVGLSGIFACAVVICLSTSTGWSEGKGPSNAPEPGTGEKSPLPPEQPPWPQQLQEQHQQLLKALEGIRQEAELNRQRYAAAVERIRKDSELSLQRFAAALDVKVDILNQTFVSEREHELQALRRSNRFALTSASVMVGILLLEILFVAWISLRAVNRLATRISAWLSKRSVFPGIVEERDGSLVQGDVIQQTTLRLQTALERFELRLLDLEHTANRFHTAATPSPATAATKVPSPQSAFKPLAALSGKPSGVSLTLGVGESLIFLPHEKEMTHFPAWRNLLQKLWKKVQPARTAKGD